MQPAARVGAGGQGLAREVIHGIIAAGEARAGDPTQGCASGRTFIGMLKQALQMGPACPRSSCSSTPSSKSHNLQTSSHRCISRSWGQPQGLLQRQRRAVRARARPRRPQPRQANSSLDAAVLPMKAARCRHEGVALELTATQVVPMPWLQQPSGRTPHLPGPV